VITAQAPGSWAHPTPDRAEKSQPAQGRGRAPPLPARAARAERGSAGARAAPADIAQHLRAEAICSGALAAEAVAHPAIGLGELDPGEVKRRAAAILELLAAEPLFVEHAATPDGLRRCLAEHGRVDAGPLTRPLHEVARSIVHMHVNRRLSVHTTT
jgi:hypothetical protein